MSTTPKLDGIRVQTARMLEIYSLLRREIDKPGHFGMPLETRQKLQGAVDTIAANMRQLADLLAAAMETPSAEETPIEVPGIGRLEPAEARELEEILDAVLKWHADLIRETAD